MGIDIDRLTPVALQPLAVSGDAETLIALVITVTP